MGVTFCLFPFVLVFVERGSHCHYVDQAVLELREIYLLLPPECWHYKNMCHHAWLVLVCLFVCFAF